MKYLKSISIFENNISDSEMLFIDLIEDGISVKLNVRNTFNGYDNDVTTIDIRSNAQTFLKEQYSEIIRQWVDLVVSDDNYDCWIETGDRNVNVLARQLNACWNFKYLPEVLPLVPAIRICVKPHTENMESLFKNISKNYYVNYNRLTKKVYITESFRYTKTRNYIQGKLFSRWFYGKFGGNTIRNIYNNENNEIIDIRRFDINFLNMIDDLEKDLKKIKKNCLFYTNACDYLEIHF